jgi:hypothetical protein
MHCTDTTSTGHSEVTNAVDEKALEDYKPRHQHAYSCLLAATLLACLPTLQQDNDLLLP